MAHWKWKVSIKLCEKNRYSWQPYKRSGMFFTLETWWGTILNFIKYGSCMTMISSFNWILGPTYYFNTNVQWQKNDEIGKHMYAYRPLIMEAMNYRRSSSRRKTCVFSIIYNNAWENKNANCKMSTWKQQHITNHIHFVIFSFWALFCWILNFCITCKSCFEQSTTADQQLFLRW